jgi:hypothetical protein
MRLALVAVCVAAIGALAVRLGHQDGCQDARQRAFSAAVRGASSRGALQADARALRTDCADIDDLSAGAVSVLLAGDTDDAVALAREATRRGPDVFSAWAALEAAERFADPAAAKRAAARARALNPRWSGPAPLPAPRGGAGP